MGGLGGGGSYASAINDRGQVVGEGKNASGAWHAFLWQNGTMTDLGTLGGKKSAATSINERGEIVGTSTTRSGQTHAFLWQDGTMPTSDRSAGRRTLGKRMRDQQARSGRRVHHVSKTATRSSTRSCGRTAR